MAKDVVYQKTLSSYGHWDVVVLGGGPSGTCAAIEAARGGAKTLLIEATGMLGGMATNALVGPFMTNYDREGKRPVVGGLYREIIERLAEQSAGLRHSGACFAPQGAVGHTHQCQRIAGGSGFR